LPWPEGEGARPMRAAGTHVVLVDGALAAYLGRGEKEIRTFLPGEEPQRSRVLRGLALALGAWAGRAVRQTLGWATANAQPLAESPLAPFLVEAGFQRWGPGFRFAGAVVPREPDAVPD
jgi:ATP-dependent Lhr-like helicase